MIVEIRGTGKHNKGAEMMLLTILQELRKIDKDFQFTIPPLPKVCEYAFYSNLGLYPKAWLEYKGFQFARFAEILPKKIRKMYGLVLDSEVDVILDASGFAYSDQWGEHDPKMMAKYAKKWKKEGKKVIFMPQAFGPFKNKNNIINMKKVIYNSDLIYARDEFSYEALLEIENNTKKIKLAPDFTSLFNGGLPKYFDKEKHQVCIVPNKRMIDKNNNSSNYLILLIKSIKYLQFNGLTPFFLIHGGEEDLALAHEINMQLEDKIDIINEENPYYIKGIIKESLGLVGSRFHSIASALYSGTIAIGTGWSHKYEYLFDGLGFHEGLINLDISDEKLYETLDLFIDPIKRDEISKVLTSHTTKQKKLSIQMFKDISEIIN